MNDHSFLKHRNDTLEREKTEKLDSCDTRDRLERQVPYDNSSLLNLKRDELVLVLKDYPFTHFYPKRVTFI